MDALCQEVLFFHLLLTAQVLSCKQRRRGTTGQLLIHVSPRKRTSPTSNVICHREEYRILNSRV